MHPPLPSGRQQTKSRHVPSVSQNTATVTASAGKKVVNIVKSGSFGGKQKTFRNAVKTRKKVWTQNSDDEDHSDTEA